MKKRGQKLLVIYAELLIMTTGTALEVNIWSHKIPPENMKFHNYLTVGGVNWWGTFPPIV